jgi:hypothetical protein
VFTTEKEAQVGEASLISMVPSTYNGLLVSGHVFYNHTGCASANGALGCIQDLYETFQQRANELDQSGSLSQFMPFMWEILNPGTDPSPILSFAAQITGITGLISELQSSLQTYEDSALTYMIGSPPTQQDYATQDQELAQYVQSGQAVLMVAHSQGNLFMTHAYQDAQAEGLQTNLLQEVGIAPATTVSIASYDLAAIDLVINGLEATSGVFAFDPNDFMAPSTSDPLGHSLTGTYLDASRGGYQRIKTMMTGGLSTLSAAGADPANLSPFMVSITSEAGSDVFLMVSEPAGALGLSATLSDGAIASTSGSGVTGAGSGLFHGNFGYLDAGAQNYYAACFNQQIAQMGVGSMSFTFGARPLMFDGADSATISVVAAGQTVASTSFVYTTSPFNMTFTVTVTVDPNTGVNSYAVAQGASP